MGDIPQRLYVHVGCELLLGTDCLNVELVDLMQVPPLLLVHPPSLFNSMVGTM